MAKKKNVQEPAEEPVLDFDYTEETLDELTSGKEEGEDE